MRQVRIEGPVDSVFRHRSRRLIRHPPRAGAQAWRLGVQQSRCRWNVGLRSKSASRNNGLNSWCISKIARPEFWSGIA